ncbi:MAG: type II secretion system F family protein [Methylobacter sp.]|nr:type II secretion system F family protein [Methylobacter sp.]
MPPKNPPLNTEQLATLFTQLKRLEASGLSVLQTLTILTQSKTELKKPLTTMLQQIKSGRSVSEAGVRAGLFNDTHKTLIHAAESSGQLTKVYGQLADYYTGLASRINKVKSRLYQPGLTLIIALFVQPLPDLVGSKITRLDYLQLSLGRLVVIGFGVFLLIKLPNILSRLGLKAAWHRVQLSIPVVAKWIIKRQVNEFFYILAIMLESGVAFSIALPKAVAGIKNSCLRKQFTPALSMLASGASVRDTLAKVPVINTIALQIVHSSEQSGKLASGILHYSQREAETINLQNDTLAEWLPRLVYSIIASWMIFSILGSQFATVIPSDI